jgi:hypothetical protein
MLPGAPRIWFQVVPEGKTIKNRIHLDIHAGGDRGVPLTTRRELVDAEVRRLTELGATAARVLQQDGLDHYGVAMTDPEGNDSMSTDGRWTRRQVADSERIGAEGVLLNARRRV